MEVRLKGALNSVGNDPVLILSDSKAAVMAVRKASKQGIGRTSGLGEVRSLISDGETEYSTGAVSLC